MMSGDEYCDQCDETVARWYEVGYSAAFMEEMLEPVHKIHSGAAKNLLVSTGAPNKSKVFEVTEDDNQG